MNTLIKHFKIFGAGALAITFVAACIIIPAGFIMAVAKYPLVLLPALAITLMYYLGRDLAKDFGWL